MPGRLRILNGPYFRDLLNQPAAVRDTARALAVPDVEGRIRKLIPKEPDRFLLTGMGSSLHAFHPLCARLNQAGHPASMVESGELARYHPRSLRDSVMVAASQSGRSAEIVRLVKRRRDSRFLIGVTNTPDSPLARHADAVVSMAAGEESTVSCKTYVATLAALAWLGDILCGPGKPRTPAAFEKASEEMEAYLANWKDHVRSLARILKGVEALFYAGRGASLSLGDMRT